MIDDTCSIRNSLATNLRTQKGCTLNRKPTNNQNLSKGIWQNDAERPRGGLRDIVYGSVWVIGARWGVRFIGLLSTLILARLLKPDDFGLVAMGAITVQFLLVFADAGQDFAVIRNSEASGEHFDTAWTMSVIIGVCVAAILVAIAPLAGWYFGDPRAVRVIQILALKPLINGFTNVGVLNFRKDLQFDREFIFLVVQRVIVFLIVVAIAFIYRSYWALIIGTLAGELVNVGISYWLHPYRPRFRLSKLREILGYSTWIQFAQIGNFLADRIDQIIVGGIAGTAALGAYNISEDVASSPTNEIVFPIARAAFPVYSRLANDLPRLAETYLGVLAISATISLSTGFGMALVASDFVPIVFGEKWNWIAPLVMWLSIGSGVLGVTRSANMVLAATANGKLFALRNWSFAFLLALGALFGGTISGPSGIAAARTFAIILFIPAVFVAIQRAIPVSSRQIVGAIWRPVIATGCMAVAVTVCGSEAPNLIPLRLVEKVAVGAITFAAASAALWYVIGCPEGPEKIAFMQARNFLVRLVANRKKIRI